MIRIAIVEDEPVQLQYLADCVGRILQDRPLRLDLFDSAKKLDTARNQIEYDLYLLDIEIGDESGLSLAKQIRQTAARPQIVFVTSHSKYALAGYEAFPIGYLVKPIDENKLATLLMLALEKVASPGSHVEITENYKKICIPTDEILALERKERKTIIHMYPGDEYDIKESLRSLHSRLPEPQRFVQIHRHIILRADYVLALHRQPTEDKTLVRMQNGKEFIASQSGIRLLKSVILDRSGKHE